MIDARDWMNLVKREAKAAHAGRFGWTEYDDLVGEGNLILCQCIGRYRPEMGVHFSVYLRASLRLGLTEYVRRGFRRWVDVEDFTDAIPEPFTGDERSYQKVVLDEAIAGMSTPAQICVRLALDPPDELLEYRVRRDGRRGTHITRHTIWKYLKDEGWYGCQITAAFDEIQTTLQTVNQ